MLPKPCHQRLALTLASLLAAVLGVAAQSETNPRFIARAEQALQAAQTDWQADTNAPGPTGQLASACFDAAALATNDTRRAAVAKLGIAAARQLLARDPKSVAGHYYLAMNLGELAQAEAPSLAAYRLVHEVEREFKAAADLDPGFDFAGPVRNLGELYFQAPGWPLSVGSKHKAREWLERAATLAPDYPENQLNLLEARLKWRQHEEAATTLKTLATLWPSAQKQFTGPAREKDWEDWTARRTALQAEFDRIYPAR